MEHQFPLVIDSSMRSDLVACPTKFYWAHIRRLQRMTATSEHLVFGGAFAGGLETVRELVYGQGYSLDDALCAGIIRILAEFGDFEPPEKSNKTAERCVEALVYFFDTWPPHTDHVQPLMIDGAIPAVEFNFALPLPGTQHPLTGEPIIFAGRMDMLATYNGQLFAEDDKTTTALGAQWISQWNLRGQFSGYCWAAREYGYNVHGAIIRGIGILKYDFKHQEVMTLRPSWMVDQWLEQTVRDVNRAIAAYREGYYDKAFDEACAKFGGCPFQSLCTSADPENWVQAEYTTNHWSPLNPHQTAENLPHTPLIAS